YWEELTEIMEWTKTHVTSVLHICWGAQAALYYHYGIDKYELRKKIFGIYNNRVADPTVKLVRGFEDVFRAPHPRFIAIEDVAVKVDPRLEVLSASDAVGAFIIMSGDVRHMMITGDLEYEATTLAEEYARDLEKGLDTAIPENYFPNDHVNERPHNTL